MLIAALVSVAGLWYSNNQVRDQLKVSRQELGVTREVQITDRYTKAVENLGNGAMDVRIGGVYALERIMQDSSRDHPTIGNVLAAYIRTHTSKPPRKGEAVPADVLAALTVLAYRSADRDSYFIIDLSGAHLPGITLSYRGRLHDGFVPGSLTADLSGANLTGASLYGADLTHVNAGGANLAGAHLDGAKGVEDLTLTGAKGVEDPG
ncbi:pentapeptide repeat-containing protein [Streptomyces sp. SCL15-4]|uniref:pentapeptide repeat-containing protein n=1 Tax=Streptomyces sp. SCL15-4 TaxID=2967221 RepID=UPI0029660157|nr:pentapeptide repeat-containing protein [Streptomyces sp. SCL15-4]